MSEPITALILDRIDKLIDPVFSLVDLPNVPLDNWQRLQQERILIQIAEPETVQVKPGQWLSVRNTEHGIFGIDESEELPRLVKLSASELLQYRLNLDVFFQKICELNGFRYVRAEERHGFYPIGRKTLGAQGVATVYFSMPNGDSDSIAQRLRMLADGTSLKVVLFPRWPDVEPSGFVDDALHITDIQTDFTIAWPLGELTGIQREPEDAYIMFCKGGSWTINYLGETIHPGTAVGLGYIAKALECSPESLHMSEWEQNLSLSSKDQKDSGGLEARAEPNQNLEATTPESIREVYKGSFHYFCGKVCEVTLVITS